MAEIPASTPALSGFAGPVTALVAGASGGIGLAFVRQLASSGKARRIWACCRNPESAQELGGLAQESDLVRLLRLDLTDEASLAAAARAVMAEGAPLELVINCAGLLHQQDGLQPERRLAEVRADWLMQAFAVNGAGPLLLAKHLEPLLPRRERAVFASLSARVGSIGDNRLGGWYAYRGSKAAQNMFIKTLSIELARRARGAICVALHPGTTETELSRPFRSGVPADKLFSADYAVERMMGVIGTLRKEDTGRFFAWDGEEIPW